MNTGLKLLALAIAIAVTLALSAGAAVPSQADETSPHGSGSGSSDDTETEGQVVGMNTLATPPLVRIGNIDGVVTLYFANVDAIAMTGLRFGDYISVVGTKLNETEFRVDTVRVDQPVSINGSTPVQGTPIVPGGYPQTTAPGTYPQTTAPGTYPQTTAPTPYPQPTSLSTSTGGTQNAPPR
jgi:hypothetical protein